MKFVLMFCGWIFAYVPEKLAVAAQEYIRFCLEGGGMHERGGAATGGECRFYGRKDAFHGNGWPVDWQYKEMTFYSK